MTLQDNPKPAIDAMIKPIAIDLSETETVLFDIIWIGATTKNKGFLAISFWEVVLLCIHYSESGLTAKRNIEEGR